MAVDLRFGCSWRNSQWAAAAENRSHCRDAVSIARAEGRIATGDASQLRMADLGGYGSGGIARPIGIGSAKSLTISTAAGSNIGPAEGKATKLPQYPEHAADIIAF
ncbi:hypothetical protein JJB98_21680 [Bradyrhizobium diazoefficiens]|nr:hypothetical protein [Bradyrhizobium diazoefficiens]QQO22361.1 hypothetical protein JJB98_21680 [Bradyrhizobium diazoefficiens]